MAIYLPAHFRHEDWRALLAQHPLATVISGEFISHLPLLLEERGEEIFLLGHLARANPHARNLGRTKVIFHGPESYVSPLWYEQCDVPTWNYVVVHAVGEARILAEEETVETLRKLSDKMEGPDGWAFHIPEGRRALHQAILAFEIRVERVEMKAKLSQNRSAADQAGVVRGLRVKGEARGLEVADWMERKR